MKKIILISLILIFLVGCVKEEPVELPNPAAVYCEEQGYTYETRTNPDGSQTGYCILNGIECEGWAYYRGECPIKCQSNDNCPKTQFCDFEGCAVETGICIDVPTMCPTLYEPVCGCNDKTYSNDCIRKMTRVSKKHDGVCEEELVKEGKPDFTGTPRIGDGCIDKLDCYNHPPVNYKGVVKYDEENVPLFSDPPMTCGSDGYCKW